MKEKSTLVQIVRSEFAELVKLSLLFCMFSVPIITVGPAVLALFELTANILKEENVKAWQDFKTAFCRWFKTGVIIEGIFAVVSGVWLLAVRFYLMAMPEHQSWMFLFLLTILVGIAFGGILIYLLTILGATRQKLKKALFYAALLFIARPGRAILSMCFLLLLALLIISYPLYALPICMFVGGAVVAVGVNCLTRKPMEQFVMETL